MDIPGLIGLIVFYVIILVVGLVVGRKFGKSSTSDAQFLANRDLGLFVASFTLSGKIYVFLACVHCVFCKMNSIVYSMNYVLSIVKLKGNNFFRFSLTYLATFQKLSFYMTI